MKTKKSKRRITKLPEGVDRDRLRSVGVNTVKEVVCNAYNLPADNLLTSTRKRAVVEPRQVIFYFLTVNKKRSLASIGSLFGNAAHYIVIHSRNQVENWIETNKEFRERIIRIAGSLTNSYN
jgi:chromosomal replication initiator protein